jgi:hypothetical protein
LTLFGNLEPPNHGIVGGLIKINWSFPLIPIGEHTQILRGLFVVPHYAYLRNDRTIHSRITIEILHELRVIPAPGVGHCQQTEARSSFMYLCGTGLTVWEKEMQVAKRMQYMGTINPFIMDNK